MEPMCLTTVVVSKVLKGQDDTLRSAYEVRTRTPDTEIQPPFLSSGLPPGSGTPSTSTELDADPAAVREAVALSKALRERIAQEEQTAQAERVQAAAASNRSRLAATVLGAGSPSREHSRRCLSPGRRLPDAPAPAG